jgi:hypothetical protein
MVWPAADIAALIDKAEAKRRTDDERLAAMTPLSTQSKQLRAEDR